jgi:hypothetical protein
MTEIDINVVKPERVVDIIVEPNLITVNVTVSGGGGAVDSVNGQTGAVVLDADDISDSATIKKFVTASEKTAIAHANRAILDAITEAFTTVLKTAYDSAVSWINTNGASILSHIASTANPHGVTKSQVGLGNVDNTSDANKPISTAVANGLAGKVDKTSWIDISTTSTITGFSMFAQRFIFYKIIDNYIFIDFYIEGASNSPSFTFTSPFNNTSGTSKFGSCGYNVNNSLVVQNPARIIINNNSNIVNITLSFTGVAYTSTGTKACSGQISFKIN